MEKLSIIILLGSVREGRESEKASKYIEERAKKYNNLNVTFVDVRDFVFNEKNKDLKKTDMITKWREIILNTDGLIIVTPEYNHSFPGELKTMLDYLKDEYKGKPVAVCGVSSGDFGGVRVVEHLMQVLEAFKMIPASEHVYFKKIKELFDENGKIKDESYNGLVKKMLDGLIDLI